jgi:hypothetical protein
VTLHVELERNLLWYLLFSQQFLLFCVNSVHAGAHYLPIETEAPLKIQEFWETHGMVE